MYYNDPLTHEDMKALSGLSLEEKISHASTVIGGWYQGWDNGCFISFSGGKDSTVVSHIVARTLNASIAPPPLYLVFSDTGLEYPEIKKFTREYCSWLQKEFPRLKIELDVVKPDMRFDNVIKTYGYPVVSKEVSGIIEAVKGVEHPRPSAIRRINGQDYLRNGSLSQYNCSKWKFLLDAPFKISNKCCGIMKKKPLNKYMKETKRKPIMGIMASESRLRKQKWQMTGCNAFEGQHPRSWPLACWNEQDVLCYLQKYKIPYCSVYGDIIESPKGLCMSGCQRTGCIFCMYGCHLEKEPNRFQMLQETHPAQYAYCMRSVKDGGLGIADVLGYMGIPYYVGQTYSEDMAGLSHRLPPNEITKKLISEHHADFSGSNNPNSHSIKCIETQKVYKTQTDAANDVQCSVYSLSKHLHGKRESVKGLHFIKE
jgi:3'-phosphoadenosine 5'-phosphosulfate sulfotransferase (PAPS reductase)/FAD synthetase